MDSRYLVPYTHNKKEKQMKLKNTELLQINNALNYLQAPATARVLSACLGIRRAIKP